MAGEHAGHRQRMRERFREGQLEGFAPHEVLELMLFYAIPQRNVNPLAHRLLDHFGTFNAVLDAPYEELMKVEGMGEYAATLVKLFQAVSARYAQNLTQERKVLPNRGAAQRHCLSLFHGQRQEHFYVVCLDSRMSVIRNELIAKGTLDEVPAYPRMVVEAVMRHNAHAAILCHNHPGGSEIPSAQDVEMTRQIVSVLGGIGVLLVDHMVIAGDRCLSMVQCGLIELQKTQTAIEANVADSAGELRIRAKLEKSGKGPK